MLMPYKNIKYLVLAFAYILIIAMISTFFLPNKVIAQGLGEEISTQPTWETNGTPYADPIVTTTTENKYYKATVNQILEEKEIDFFGRKQQYQKIELIIEDGDFQGKTIQIENGNFPVAQSIKYLKGDKVILSYKKSVDNVDVFFITDYQRTNGLLYLFIIFVVASIVIGSKKGVFSLISLAISFLIIFLIVLPQIQVGRDPVLIAILAALLITPITFYLSHGFSKKTTIAILGTFISLIITGVLANIFVVNTYLTGSASEDAMFLQTVGETVYNLKGLLMAGIIIGTLGVLDDITVSQAAIVYQLYDIKKEIKFKELFFRAIQIGKDHIASVINTLVLVYTGASLPLLLLFMNNSNTFTQVLNLESIATEVVRTLVGSIGLILAVPITTYLAAIYVSTYGVKLKDLEKDANQHNIGHSH